MSTKTNSKFRSLNKQQCCEVYPVIRQNAAKHFHAAKLLASHKDYGNGIAHLILGTEEQIKSIVLMLQGYDFPVRDIVYYDKLFYLHSARHNVLKEFHSIFVFADSISKYSAARKLKNNNETFGQMFMGGLQSVKKGVENYIWWDSADKLKQNCFYLDYTDEGLIDPAIIDEKQWNIALKFVSKFTLDLQVLMETVANATDRELANFRSQFIESEMVEMVSESINRKRKV